MNIQLRIDLPLGKSRDRISGVYRISFDNGMFYLGSSTHLRQRAMSWRRSLSGKGVDRRHIWPSFIDKVKYCKEATFEILVPVHPEGLLKMEELCMTEERGNSRMINIILHPKNEIIVKNLQGVELYRYPSLQGLAKKLGLYQRRIQDVCNGRRNHTGELKFEYANQHLRNPIIKKEKSEKPNKIFKYSVSGDRICGYKTLVAAAKDTGVSRRCIYSVLHGSQKTTGGFVFKYAS